jgi:predicted GIY-YIG superfamily endonuclease
MDVLDNSQKHYCYVLYNIKQPQRTYVGYTTNPTRRLRQHNGIISGGARATSGKGEWTFLVLVTSPFFNTHTGLSFEWHLKRALRPQKPTGASKRIEALFKTLNENSKFNHFDFHIYISTYAQSVFPEQNINDLSRPNVVVYDTIDDLFG